MDRRLVLILIMLLVSGITLSVAAYVFGVFPFDLEVALWLREFDHPIFIAVMGAVSFLGDRWVSVILVFTVAAICTIKKKRIEAIFVLATLSSVILAGVLKMLVGRPRPPGFSMNPSDLFQSFNQYAYPSGHVLFFVVFFGFVAFLAWKFFIGWMRWVTISICATLIVLIGPSRILLGEHWVSDVVGSYIIGTFWLIILILLYLMVLHWRSAMTLKSANRMQI
ncbi:MAG: phosphatase PAP2 family protein [Methanoregulaceae archaeon]|nr:phosphatase PAP2 family protein [Methanoregulaceae archaeon]